MCKFLAGVSALALLSLTVPAAAAEASGKGLRANADQYEFSGHRRSYRHRHRPVRRYARPSWAPAYGYGGYAGMRDPLGLNPAVEFYRRQGRCVMDEGYGRYSFCDGPW